MSYTDSVTAEGSLDLTGVWIHDPLDPEGTVEHYLYGASSRQTAIDTLGQTQHYVGREYPVTDFGEHEETVATIALQVPHGATWQAQIIRLEELARAKRTLWVRDNRGRSWLGTLEGFTIRDADHGSDVTFTVRRAHQDVTEV